jgi:hypothetical protein
MEDSTSYFKPFFFFFLYPFCPLERWGGLPRLFPRLPLFLRITIYSRQVISLALEVRYLGQLDSPIFTSPREPGWPSYTPRHWVLILVAFYGTHGLRWGYSLLPATTRDVFETHPVIKSTSQTSLYLFTSTVMSCDDKI